MENHQGIRRRLAVHEHLSRGRKRRVAAVFVRTAGDQTEANTKSQNTPHGAVLSILGKPYAVPITGEQDHDLGIETLADELDMAIGKQEVGAAGVETVKALDVGAIDGAGAAAGRIEAVVGVAADPLVAVGFIGPGVAGDVKTG